MKTPLNVQLRRKNNGRWRIWQLADYIDTSSMQRTQADLAVWQFGILNGGGLSGLHCIYTVYTWVHIYKRT